ncbi:MAG TPA: hypothetical protein VGJ04_08005, partial [Pirellulales bacterium]
LTNLRSSERVELRQSRSSRFRREQLFDMPKQIVGEKGFGNDGGGASRLQAGNIFGAWETD